MSKEKIFKLIREEKVVLWIGAGMSKYAGYPIGHELVEILYNKLNKNAKEYILPDLSLPELSKELIRYNNGSRNELIALLRSIYSTSKSRLTYHKKLATIPHITDIVTTNYDTLLERSYKNARVITREIDLPYRNECKQAIYKIHGDLELNPDGLIITQEDFYEFTKTSNLLFSHIRSLIASKTILFIGYNLEDTHIYTEFNTIMKSLGSNFRPAFLVSPKLNNTKINELSRHGITYIKSKGEKFIDELLQNIKDNIHDDFEKELIGADTYRAFLNVNNISPNFSSKGQKLFLSGINSNNGKSLKRLLQFDVDLNDRNQLVDLFNGKRQFGTIRANNIKEIIEGITFKIQDVHSLIFEQHPNAIFNISVIFEDCEMFDVRLELFSTEFSFTQKYIFKSGYLLIEGPALKKSEITQNIEYKVHGKHTENYNRTQDEIDFFRFVRKAMAGELYTIHFENGDKRSIRYSPTENKYGEYELEYFELLQSIENHYKIRFRNIDVISDENFNKMSMIKCSMTGETVECIWDRPKILPYKPDTFPILQDGNYNIINQSDEEVVIELYGLKFNIGYELRQYQEVYAANKDEVELGKTTRVLVKGKTETVLISYSKTNINPIIEEVAKKNNLLD